MACMRLLVSSVGSVFSAVYEGVPAGLLHAAQLFAPAHHHQHHVCSNSEEQCCSTTAAIVQEKVSAAPSRPAGAFLLYKISCIPSACDHVSIPFIPHAQQWTASYSTAALDSSAGKPVTSQTTHLQQQWKAEFCALDTTLQRLTRQVQGCRSVQQLQCLITAHTQHMNHIHATAAIGRLTTLCGRTTMQHQGQHQQQDQQQQQQASQAMSMLWKILQQQLSNCTSRELSNIIYNLLCKAPAAIQQQYQPAVMQQLIPAFLQQLQLAAPQAVSTVMYGLARTQQQVPAQQVQQLVKRLVDTAQRASPQAIANTLWAVATMQHQVPQLHVNCLINALAAKVQLAKPQEISASLWAVAVMNQPLQEHQLQQLLQAFSKQLKVANPQSVSTAIWACARLNYRPMQLLSHPELASQLPIAGSRSLVNIAWACGSLGYRNEQLMRHILQQVQLRIQEQCQQHGHMSELDLLLDDGKAVVAWSVAVLDLRQHAGEIAQLLMPLSSSWDRLQEQNLQQLHQVHCWLLDIQYGKGQGLSDIFTTEQLQHCQEAYSRRQLTSAALLAGRTTSLQKQVFAVASWLPVSWQQQLQLEQVTADGLLTIDIAGKTSSGQLVAVEVDGPTHFVAPDNSLKGPTQYRNRALAARGYKVISVPYFEWLKLKSGRDRKEYLLQLFVAAGVA